MTTDDPFDTYDVPRDRWGRPVIKPENGEGKGSAYTRCTTYVGCLEDTFNLSKWQQRMVALGLAARPDLLLSVSAHSDDKQQLNTLCDEAREAAGSSAAATTGTALHRICERLDRGEDVVVPEAARADIESYRAVTAGIRWTLIERITVHDGLKVAGTPDRIGVAPGETTAKVWDVKTGGLDFGLGKIAMQMAMYAHSRAYDPATGQRTDLDVDLERAVIIHLPAGKGDCRLVEVDIAAGWEAVQLAAQVRAWRSRKDLSRPYALATPPAVDYVALAAEATTLPALFDLHARAVAADAWNHVVKSAFGIRKAQITATEAAA